MSQTEDRRRASLGNLVDVLRRRIAQTASEPFSHAAYPLANTLDYVGDPGLIGPDSVSWRVLGDVASFVGGIRGLLIQAAHPEVVAGVGDHSRYREDPLGRLSRTSSYVTATTFGAIPEVEQAVERVSRIHRMVTGVSSRGIPYNASDPGFSAWVHNALTDSFLVAHQTYGGTKLSPSEADRFVAEQALVGGLMGADPIPRTAQALAGWMSNHPAVAPSPAMEDAIDFLTDPPLERSLGMGYRVLMQAAVATIPRRLRDVLGLEIVRTGAPVGRAAVAGLRWAMGYSPSWQIALMRTNADIPEGLFKQPLRAG